MEMMRYGSSGGLPTLRREIDDIFDRFFNEPVFSSAIHRRREWIPSIDVSETRDAIMVKADLPGMESKDIEVNLQSGTLTIKGEEKAEEEKRDEYFHYQERRRGSFQRSIRLPVDVKEDKVEASFKNGILNIKIPKAEEVKRKLVTIRDE